MSSPRLRELVVDASLLGTRDLHAHIVRIALLAQENEDARVILRAAMPKMSVKTLEETWHQATSLLRKDIAARVGLVASAANGTVYIPKGMSMLVRALAVEQAQRHRSWTPKSFAVWRVLFDAWLRGEGPLTGSEVQTRADVSHPTVRAVADLLSERGELQRESSRRLSLTGVPRQSLQEVVALAASLRETHAYADLTGRAPAPERLVKRLSGLTDIRISGVAAARRYDSAFDLNGTPRVDVVVPDTLAKDWIADVDAALEPARSGQAPLLVTHMRRGAPEPGPLASPAEVVLDLMELGLVAQANALIDTLRARTA